MTSIVFPLWDDRKTAKKYRNIIDDETKDYVSSTDELMDRVCDFFNTARQGWSFEVEGNETSGYVIRAILKPTTNRAKEMATKGDNDQ